MKIKYIALILLLSVSLTSCGNKDTKYSPSISEAEVFKIMDEVAGEYGIHLEREALTIENVNRPYGYYWKNEYISGGTFDILIDGYDKGKKVGYEYISSEEQSKYYTESLNELDNIESLTGDKDKDKLLRSSGVVYFPEHMEESINSKDKGWNIKVFKNNLSIAQIKEEAKDFFSQHAQK